MTFVLAAAAARCASHGDSWPQAIEMLGILALIGLSIWVFR